MIPYQDFAKLDIKIGTIIEAEKITGTDRLLRLIVDLGEEKRQLVGGLAPKYQPEDLIGQQIPVIVNLEPAIIRGVESNGMLMAAGNQEPTLLIPDQKIPNGSKVK